MPPPLFLLSQNAPSPQDPQSVPGYFCSKRQNRGSSNHTEPSKSLDRRLTLLKWVGEDMKDLSISSRHSLFHTSSCWLTPPCPTHLLVHLFQPSPTRLEALLTYRYIERKVLLCVRPIRLLPSRTLPPSRDTGHHKGRDGR